MPTIRRGMNVLLAEDSLDRFQEFAREAGCSVSALMQAFIDDVLDEVRAAGPDIREDWVKKARHIDADRRRR